MSDDRGTTTRRRILLGLGAATAGAFAGCASGGDGGDGGGATATEAGTETATATPAETATPSETATPTATPSGELSGDVPAAIDDHLADAVGYEGMILDATGQESVTVAVGGGALAFDPVAVRIDSSTTVNWEWEGGFHNVASTGGSESDFDSGDPTDDTETVFSQSFDNTGVQLYVCEVHQGNGMLGAVDVV